MRRWAVRIGLSAVLLAGCLVVLDEGIVYPGTTSLSAEEAAIYEAVFRYQFLHNASAAQQQARAYFLQVDGKNPPPDFLECFSGHAPPVTKGSRFRLHGTGGLLFRVDGIKWLDDDHVEVGGGYYEGPLSASGNTYHVTRKAGVWVVERDVMWMIS